MAEIKLQGGYVAAVDIEDLPKVQCYHWYADRVNNVVYARARIKTKEGKITTVLMHRLVMDAQKGQLIDHKDRNGLNNSRSNLRFASKQGNSANTPGIENTSSKYKGVTWDKNRGKWKARICSTNIGRYDSEEAAALAYNTMAQTIFGEFAYINDIGDGPSCHG